MAGPLQTPEGAKPYFPVLIWNCAKKKMEFIPTPQQLPCTTAFVIIRTSECGEITTRDQHMIHIGLMFGQNLNAE